MEEKRYGVCNIIIKAKSYTFENLKTKFIINRILKNNSKNVDCLIKCNKCKEVYVDSTQALNTRISLNKNNINLQENKKLNTNTNVAVDHSKQCLYTKLTTSHYFK